MQKQAPSRLLPIGFYDLLFDEAEKNHRNINKILSVFFAASYRLIKTPLVEFEENFITLEKENSFRATDIISGKSLVFRNDITLQICRLLDSRLKNKQLPLRLCYVGDVLCAKSDGLYADRQQTQLGIELIGCDKEKSNFEIIEILLVALQKLKLKNLLIEFSLPGFLEIFLGEVCQIKSEEKKQELLEAVMKKNLSAIKKLAEKDYEIIKEIATLNTDLKTLSKRILAAVKNAKTNLKKISDKLSLAQEILQFLQKEFPQIEIGFDLFGDHKTSYHSEISFDVFCANFSYPIARGGRYKINDLDAVGATIYMNRLRKI